MRRYLLCFHLLFLPSRSFRFVVVVTVVCALSSYFLLYSLFQVDYFPSRYDPVRHAERHPIPSNVINGKRERQIIAKENNFKQPGERYRSMDPARQERFICRVVDALSDPRITHEIRSIWVSYWSQADKSLGMKVASRLNVRPTM